MEKMLTSEFSKTLILLGLGGISIITVLTNLIKRVRGGFKVFQKATCIYLFIALLFFAAIASMPYWLATESHIFMYVLCQFYFLLIGTAHVYGMHTYLKWSGDGKAFWLELLFTFLTSLLGSIGFLLVYRFFSRDGFEYNMATSIYFFIFPWLVYQTFIKALAIPPIVLKQWLYPLQEEILPAPPKGAVLIISFDLQKQTTDTNTTQFRVKAPIDMEFGRLFYFFVNEYNEKNPDSKIDLTSKTGELNSWIFRKKPKWYTVFTAYIDASRTIVNNRIKENDIIICNRANN